MNLQRSSGILLHPTSLPSPDGIGDLGPEAYRWIDFLHASGTQLWQILPLGPTGYGDSPYQCFSAFAGNPFLVSPILLLESGLLKPSDLRQRPEFPETSVDFGPVIQWKNHLLDTTYENYLSLNSTEIRDQFNQFQAANSQWLDDYGLFMAIKESQGGRSWSDWPKALKFREPETLEQVRQNLATIIEKVKFSQFLFNQQWQNLKNYAHSKEIRIIGDMPFVIAFDSADTWANPQLFLMDKSLSPTMVAGVPPDYFSATGQLWGNPLYNWPLHSEQNYDWWARRLGAVLSMVDLVRLDHFRGFAAAWHVPFGSETAIHGEWINSPGLALFTELKYRFPDLPIIAEDLGVITPDVEELRDGFGFPGMKKFSSLPSAAIQRITSCLITTRKIALLTPAHMITKPPKVGLIMPLPKKRNSAWITLEPMKLKFHTGWFGKSGGLSPGWPLLRCRIFLGWVPKRG